MYSMKKLALVLFLYLSIGCNEDSTYVDADYKSYQFDLKVIERLPMYDSVAFAILENIPVFHQYITEDDSYRAYKYMPSSEQPEVFKKLPVEVAPKIDRYLTMLGKDFIYGFDVFKDSTIKIYVRSQTSVETQITIEENLSYFHSTKNIKKREKPIKDTILNEHWQYWTRIQKRSLF
jgi:hypothetical protein